MEYSTTVLESQLDYLTVAVHTEDKLHELAGLAHGIQFVENSLGAKLAPWRLKGYAGWRQGRISYGERERAGLVQVSGAAADEHAAALVDLADSITRLDLAVTVRFPPGNSWVGPLAYHQATAWHDDHPQSALPWQVSDARGGHSVYLGVRTSHQMLRLYNKAQECRARRDPDELDRYANAWRYELESHDLYAFLYAHEVVKSVDRPRWVQSLLWSYVEDHGITPQFPRDGPPPTLKGFRRRSDYDTRMQWLQRSVQPAVTWLMQYGDRERILFALGLDSPPEPLDKPE